MGTSNDLACYLNQPRYRSFSVTKTDKLAVKVATVLISKFPDDAAGPITVDNSGSFIDFISRATGYNYARCAAMLRLLQPISWDRESALRIAYATLGYLPCFEKDDMKAESAYRGVPDFKVHGRIIAARAYYDINKQPTVDLIFQAMSSILAGRQYSMRMPAYVIDKLLRKVYSGKSRYGEIPPVEISGVYVSVNSSWLAGSPLDLEKVSCTADMRTRNKQLYTNRSNRKCTVAKSCAICNKGRDQCAIAVRRKTKEESDDVRGCTASGVS